MTLQSQATFFKIPICDVLSINLTISPNFNLQNNTNPVTTFVTSCLKFYSKLLLISYDHTVLTSACPSSCVCVPHTATTTTAVLSVMTQVNPGDPPTAAINMASSRQPAKWYTQQQHHLTYTHIHTRIHALVHILDCVCPWDSARDHSRSLYNTLLPNHQEILWLSLPCQATGYEMYSFTCNLG